MRADRRGTAWTLLAAILLTLAAAGVAAQAPSSVPTSSPSPIATPAWPPPPGDGTTPSGLPWQPVSPDLSKGRWLSQFSEWRGGLAAIEKGDEDDRAYAVWTSPDGL